MDNSSRTYLKNKCVEELYKVISLVSKLYKGNDDSHVLFNSSPVTFSQFEALFDFIEHNKQINYHFDCPYLSPSI